MYSDNNKQIEIMKIQLTEDLASAKGQLIYVEEALAWEGLENWERKEFEVSKQELVLKIESLTYRLSL